MGAVLYKISDLYQLGGLKIISGLECEFTLSEMREWFNQQFIRAPRTGHLGDWTSFVQHCGAATDFNFWSMQLGLGRPLVVNSNWTSTFDGSGDQVYRPQSYLEDGLRLDKTIWCRRQGQMKRLNPNQSTWAPHCFTDSVATQSLWAFHRQRWADRFATELDCEADFLLRKESQVRSVFELLLRSASLDENPKRLLSSVIAHVALASEELIPARQFSYEGSIWQINEILIGDSERCADALIAGLRFLANSYHPEAEHEHMIFPSGLFILYLEAVLGADLMLPNQESPVHFHWGARGMVGYPPFAPGYLFSKTPERRLRAIHQVAQSVTGQDRVLVALPAAVLNLLPVPGDDRERSVLIHLLSQFDAKDLAKTQLRQEILQVAGQLGRGFCRRLREVSFYDSNELRRFDHSDAENGVPRIFWERSLRDLTLFASIIYQGLIMSSEQTRELEISS